MSVDVMGAHSGGRLWQTGCSSLTSCSGEQRQKENLTAVGGLIIVRLPLHFHSVPRAVVKPHVPWLHRYSRSFSLLSNRCGMVLVASELNLEALLVWIGGCLISLPRHVRDVPGILFRCN